MSTPFETADVTGRRHRRNSARREDHRTSRATAPLHNRLDWKEPASQQSDGVTSLREFHAHAGNRPASVRHSGETHASDESRTRRSQSTPHRWQRAQNGGTPEVALARINRDLKFARPGSRRDCGRRTRIERASAVGASPGDARPVGFRFAGNHPAVDTGCGCGGGRGVSGRRVTCTTARGESSGPLSFQAVDQVISALDQELTDFRDQEVDQGGRALDRSIKGSIKGSELLIKGSLSGDHRSRATVKSSDSLIQGL